MTDWKDRLLDNLLDEKIGGQVPPDQVEEILSNASGQIKPDPPKTLLQPVDASPGSSTNGSRGSVSRLTWRGLRPAWQVASLSAAAIVVLIVASWATRGWFGEERDRHQARTQRDAATGGAEITNVGLVDRQGFVMPVSTQTNQMMGRTILHDGWLFADEHSPEMMVGVSLLQFQGARAVVWVGRVPNSYEAANIARLLRESGIIRTEEEFEMLFHSKNWFAGLGLAVCILSGQAVVNSQEVQSGGDDQITVERIFDRFDVDDSGKIELSECVCEHSRQCDLNEDGEITREEFSEATKQLAGSHEALIHMVHERGGIEAFYQAAKHGLLDDVSKVSMESVFAFLDKDESGVLEPGECICPGSKSADANENGEVTPAELSAVAVEFFGSEEAFLAVVREKGGVAEFFHSILQEDLHGGNESSFDTVFTLYDRNRSGSLEANECVCHGSKMADSDGDGLVTKDELRSVAVEMFGSIEHFEKYIEHCGGAGEFYRSVSKRDHDRRH